VSSVVDTVSRRATVTLGTFERYLTIWVALCIVAGIVLGQLLPGPFQALGRMTIAEVNIPVAILIWLMIVPMLLKVDFGALHRVAEQWRGIAVTVGINWLVKPGPCPTSFRRPSCDPSWRRSVHSAGRPIGAGSGCRAWAKRQPLTRP
jgi:hypothetical protein